MSPVAAGGRGRHAGHGRHQHQHGGQQHHGHLGQRYHYSINVLQPSTTPHVMLVTLKPRIFKNHGLDKILNDHNEGKSHFTPCLSPCANSWSAVWQRTGNNVSVSPAPACSGGGWTLVWTIAWTIQTRHHSDIACHADLTQASCYLYHPSTLGAYTIHQRWTMNSFKHQHNGGTKENIFCTYLHKHFNIFYLMNGKFHLIVFLWAMLAAIVDWLVIPSLTDRL